MKKSFSAWMALVDAAISSKIGLSSSDLPDCPYWDWWDGGMSYAAAAKRALRRGMVD